MENGKMCVIDNSLNFEDAITNVVLLACLIKNAPFYKYGKNIKLYDTRDIFTYFGDPN